MVCRGAETKKKVVHNVEQTWQQTNKLMWWISLHLTVVVYISNNRKLKMSNSQCNVIIPYNVDADSESNMMLYQIF